MDALHILVQQGKVLYLGISDTPAWIVSAANEYATAHGKTPFSIYQGRWNIMIRDMERDIVPMARHYGMALAPWDVLGGGKFQTKKALEERKKNNEGMRNILGDRSAPQTEAPAGVAFVGGPERLEEILAQSDYLAGVGRKGDKFVIIFDLARLMASTDMPVPGEAELDTSVAV